MFDKKDKRICAVVVIYQPNLRDLENIKKFSTFVEKVYIVDNSEEKVTDLEICSSERFVYLFVGYNSGFGPGYNIGCKQALLDGFQFALTMNPDSELIESNFDRFVSQVDILKDAAIIAPQYIFGRGKKYIEKDSVNFVDFAMTSGSITNLEILSKLGWFEESFFIDGEDYDYCLRAWENGYKCYETHFYAIIHNPGIEKTSRFFHLKYGYFSPLRAYYQSRNMRELIRRHKKKRFFLLLFMCWKYFKILFFFDDKRAFKDMWRKGKRDYKQRRFGEYKQ